MSGPMGLPDFATPRDGRALEDYRPGATYRFGTIGVTEAEILDFGRRYDPQPIHIDLDFANAGPFGGLIASGWQTSALMMRLLADHYLPTRASLASPGVDELRWLKPLRPGDELSIRVTVLEARRSRSKPDRGVVRSQVEVLNQHDEVIMTMIATNFVHTRAALDAL
jgi:acyl dehydratase